MRRASSGASPGPTALRRGRRTPSEPLRDRVDERLRSAKGQSVQRQSLQVEVVRFLLLHVVLIAEQQARLAPEDLPRREIAQARTQHDGGLEPRGAPRRVELYGRRVEVGHGSLEIG